MSGCILIACNVESGASNVMLAVSQQLAAVKADVQIASYQGLKGRVAREVPGTPFHQLGPDDFRGLAAVEDVTRHKPGYASSAPFQVSEAVFTAIKPDRYVAIIDELIALFDRLKPSLVVVDIAQGPARDACIKSGQSTPVCATAARSVDRMLIVSPNAASDLCGLSQPGLRGLWQYPFTFSGLPYPLDNPLNFLLNLVTIFRIAIMFIRGSKKMNELKEKRVAYGLDGVHPIMRQHTIGPPFYLVADTPGMDFPLLWVPDNYYRVGPLLPTIGSFEDPSGLMLWLDRASTILINFGTLFQPVANDAEVIGTALGQALPEGCQALVKLPNATELRPLLTSKLDGADDQIRVVDWVDVPPRAVLEHKNLILSVNHGGANSFNEAIVAGVPQIVMPGWCDCFGYAIKAEYLGVGIYGNRRSVPSFNAPELAAALRRILVTDANAYRRRARELADLAKAGGGVERAADIILRDAGLRA